MWWNDGETRSAGVPWLHPTIPGCLIISFGCSSRLLFSVLIRWCSVMLRRCASVALHCETVDKCLRICTFHCPFSKPVLHCKTAVWNQTSYTVLLWDSHSLSVFFTSVLLNAKLHFSPHKTKRKVITTMLTLSHVHQPHVVKMRITTKGKKCFPLEIFFYP